MDEKVSIKLTTSLEVNVSEESRLYALLNREATAAKSAGDWTRAIALLREAKALRGLLYEDVRLAKFLQQAGRVEESLAEVQWLIENAHTWAEENFSHQPRTVRRHIQAEHLSRLHREGVRICKRANRPDTQAHHASEHARWTALAQKLKFAAEETTRQRQQEYELACDARRHGDRAAMYAYFRKWRSDLSE